MKKILLCCVPALMAGGAWAQGSGAPAHGTLFGDVFPGSTIWQASGSNTYFDPGTGTGKVMINTDTPADGSAYLTVDASVAANGWYGMVMQSSTATGVPYYKYVAGSESAIHWFNPATDAWSVTIKNDVDFQLYDGGDASFKGDVVADGNVAAGGNVLADRYLLNNTRHLNAWVTQYQPFLSSTSGERVYTIDLPDGATLVAIDNSGTYNFSATLYPTELDGSLGTAIFSVGTSGTGAGQRTFYASSFVDPTIDTVNNTYIVVMSNALDAVSDLSFVTLRVYYTLDEL